MKVHKVPQMNPKTQQKGYATRAVLNGQESWDDLIEYAARNTSIHKAELTAAATLIIEGAVMALKNGKSVDLRELGKIYPTVYGKWTETAEEQKKSNLTLGMNYRPSDEINEAIAGIKLSWSTKAEEEAETTDPENGGTSGGTQNGGSAAPSNGGTSQNQNNNNGGGTTQSGGGTSQSGSGTTYNLTIARSGQGSSVVKDGNGNVLTGIPHMAAGATVSVEITPFPGQECYVKLNSSNIELTESDGKQVCTFQMPDRSSMLEIYSGTDPDYRGDEN